MINDKISIQEYFKQRFPPVVIIDTDSCTNAYEVLVSRIVNGFMIYGGLETSKNYPNDDTYTKYTMYPSELNLMLEAELNFIKEDLEKISKEELIARYEKK